MDNKLRSFGVKDQVGYVFGDMAGSFVNLYYDAFFLLFATYVLKIDPKFMSAMFLFARLFDAVNDPIIGSFPDRWHIGKTTDKFKPYIKIFMWPLAFSVIIGFFDVSSSSELFKHVWVVFSYILYGISYTGTSMPFGAMASVITDDPIERTKLSRARAIGGMLVAVGFLSFVPNFIWDKDNNPVASGYFYIACVFAMLSVFSYIMLMKLTEERIVQKQNPDKKFQYSKVLKNAFSNRPLIGIMFASIGSLIFITGNSQFGSFMFKEYYNMPKLIQLSMLSVIPITLILFPLIPKLAAKFGKRRVLITTLVFNFVMSTFLFLVPIPNPYVFILINLIATIGQYVFTMLVWAFVTDSLDYNEYKTGDRNDGSLYSIYTFARKIGSTLASAGVSFVLGSIGFVAGASQQLPDVVLNIRKLGTGVPLIAVIIELIGIALIYNLSDKKTSEMHLELEKMRA